VIDASVLSIASGRGGKAPSAAAASTAAIVPSTAYRTRLREEFVTLPPDGSGGSGGSDGGDGGDGRLRRCHTYAGGDSPHHPPPGGTYTAAAAHLW